MKTTLSQLFQPHALIHRGTIEAHALFFDVAFLGEVTARRRVLQNWDSGAQVYKVADGYLLRLAAPRRVTCEIAPGLPLTEEKGLLIAAPLTQHERHALEITSESLVLLRNGTSQVFSLAGLTPIDIAVWLDVSRFETLALSSLGEAPPPPPLLVQQTTFDARQKLGVEAAPELEKLLAQMRGGEAEKEAQGPLFARLLAEMGAWWQGLKQSLTGTHSQKTTASSMANEMASGAAKTFGKPSVVAIFLALLQISFIAFAALLMMSLPLSNINFSVLLLAFFIGLVLYVGLVVVWSLLFWVFVSSRSALKNAGSLKWLLGGALLIMALSLFSTGQNFDWQAFFAKMVALLLVLLVLLLVGVLLIGLLLWAVRNFEPATKPKLPVAPSTAVDTPAPLVIGSAALGVFIGAMGHGDILVAIISAIVMLAVLIYSLLQFQKQRLARASGAIASTPAVSTPKPKPLTSLMPPEPVEGPFAALRNALARALWMAGLWRIYGPIQARYIARLMDMFARGDLDNALRHAIPMGGAGTGKATPAFGLPIPRSVLEIFTGRRVGASVLPMPPDIAEQLRQQYRAAFERLDAQGRYEEAAFVLAELLHASAEAVAYLERQKRLRLAAELAESRDLPPDLIVRQWLVAGEQERALWMARRKNAFSAAITRLGNGSDADKENARKLRLLWANELARGGDFVAAVSAAWPVVEARHLVGEWMKHGLLLGGSAKARMLAWRCQIGTTLEAELRETVLEFLQEPDAAEARLTFARCLNEGTQTPVTKTLARATTRALLSDAAGDDFNEVRKAACQKLIESSGDGALRADVPARLFVSTRNSLKEREYPIEIVIEADDTGALPLCDAAYLPDGRTIVALGEAGARLLAREGRTIAHFDQPCHRLVVSDHGDRALALAPRGQATRIAKLDFSTRRALSWCETRLDACAFSYDGTLWFLASQGSIFAIDASSQKFGALWHTPDVGDVTCIERSLHSCAFLTRFMVSENFGFRMREKWERWQLEVPSLILRQRTVIASWGVVVGESASNFYAKTVAPDGVWSCLEFSIGEGAGTITLSGQALSLTTSQPVETPYSLKVCSAWWLACIRNELGIEAFLVDRAKAQVRARFIFKGSRFVETRFGENHLTLCDERGRLLVFDLERGALVKNFRLS